MLQPCFMSSTAVLFFQPILLLQHLGIWSRYCVDGGSASLQGGSPQKHLPSVITAVHKVGHQAIEKRSGKSEFGIHVFPSFFFFKKDRKRALWSRPDSHWNILCYSIMCFTLMVHRHGRKGGRYKHDITRLKSLMYLLSYVCWIETLKGKIAECFNVNY